MLLAAAHEWNPFAGFAIAAVPCNDMAPLADSMTYSFRECTMSRSSNDLRQGLKCLVTSLETSMPNDQSLQTLPSPSSAESSPAGSLCLDTSCSGSTPNTSTESSPVKSKLDGSAASLSTPPVSPDHPNLRCMICKAEFTGAPQHQASNLRRHMRNIHRQRIRLQCLELKCSAEFWRSDNLRKHRRTSHGLIEPPMRHNAQKRRRDDTPRQDLWYSFPNVEH